VAVDAFPGVPLRPGDSMGFASQVLAPAFAYEGIWGDVSASRWLSGTYFQPNDAWPCLVEGPRVYPEFGSVAAIIGGAIMSVLVRPGQVPVVAGLPPMG